ncbi:MAG TPA: hypothetical protein VI112_15140 [Bacteroidia bacterium]
MIRYILIYLAWYAGGMIFFNIIGASQDANGQTATTGFFFLYLIFLTVIFLARGFERLRGFNKFIFAILVMLTTYLSFPFD